MEMQELNTERWRQPRQEPLWASTEGEQLHGTVGSKCWLTDCAAEGTGFHMRVASAHRLAVQCVFFLDPLFRRPVLDASCPTGWNVSPRRFIFQ